MAQFLLIYLEQPQMSSPEDGKAHMGNGWTGWPALGRLWSIPLLR